MLAVPFLIGCLDRTPETYHSVGIRRGTATSNFHLQRDNLTMGNLIPTLLLHTSFAAYYTNMSTSAVYQAAHFRGGQS